MMFYKECRPTKLKKRPNYALSILGFKQFQLSVISQELWCDGKMGSGGVSS